MKCFSRLILKTRGLFAKWGKRLFFAKACCQRPVSNHERKAEAEGWPVRKDGAKFWVNAVITPMYEVNGALRGYSKVVHDISDRRQAEEKLKARKRVVPGAQAFYESWWFSSWFWVELGGSGILLPTTRSHSTFPQRNQTDWTRWRARR